MDQACPEVLHIAGTDSISFKIGIFLKDYIHVGVFRAEHTCLTFMF